MPVIPLVARPCRLPGRLLKANEKSGGRQDDDHCLWSRIHNFRRTKSVKGKGPMPAEESSLWPLHPGAHGGGDRSVGWCADTDQKETTTWHRLPSVETCTGERRRWGSRLVAGPATSRLRGHHLARECRLVGRLPTLDADGFITDGNRTAQPHRGSLGYSSKAQAAEPPYALWSLAWPKAASLGPVPPAPAGGVVDGPVGFCPSPTSPVCRSTSCTLRQHAQIRGPKGRDDIIPMVNVLRLGKVRSDVRSARFSLNRHQQYQWVIRLALVSARRPKS
jgi:hypothetical protein